MKKSLLVAALGLLMSASACVAQPADGPGLAKNPDAADAQKQALDHAMAEGRKQAEALMAMTPVQRREWMDNMVIQQFRTVMDASGVGPKPQERIEIFLRAQNTARVKLREVSGRLRDAISNKEALPENVALLVSEYEAAAAAERARKATADAELATELELKQQPKLDGFLRLYGVIGDGPSLAGNILAGLTTLATLPDPAEMAPR